MQISNTAAALIIALALLGLFLYGGCKKGGNENFTRTCTSADTNCRFVRSPVDYAFLDGSEIPAHVAAQQAMTIPFPHLAGNPHDKLQPLDDPCVGNVMANGRPDMQPCGVSRINLIQDEAKLWNPDKLWKQYEHNYKGCGNGKPYIVNDDKTRHELSDIGNEWAVRVLDHQRLPQHGPRGRNPALTDLDMIEPDQFDELYGGSWLRKNRSVGMP